MVFKGSFQLKWFYRERKESKVLSALPKMILSISYSYNEIIRLADTAQHPTDSWKPNVSLQNIRTGHLYAFRQLNANVKDLPRVTESSSKDWTLLIRTHYFNPMIQLEPQVPHVKDQKDAQVCAAREMLSCFSSGNMYCLLWQPGRLQSMVTHGRRDWENRGRTAHCYHTQ